MISETVTLITSAAKAASVPPLALLALCFTESSFRNVIVPEDGKSASVGICQLKQATAREVDPTVRATDLLIPETNARLAALYLAYQLKRYGNNLRKAFDAYNRGHAKLAGGHSRYSDTVLRNMRVKPWMALIRKEAQRLRKRRQWLSTHAHSA